MFLQKKKKIKFALFSFALLSCKTMLSSIIKQRLKEERSINHPWRINWRDLLESGKQLYDMLSHMMVSWCKIPLEIDQLIVSYLPLFTIQYNIEGGLSSQYTLSDEDHRQLVAGQKGEEFSYRIDPVRLSANIQCPDTGFICETQTGYISTGLVLYPPEQEDMILYRTTSKWNVWQHGNRDLFHVEVVTQPHWRNIKILSLLFPSSVEDLVFKHAI